MVERIKELCAQRDMSLKDLEQATGIGTNSIYKWDKQSPAVKYVALVARYFAVSADYLITGEESAMPNVERSLIAKFRLLDDTQKTAVFALIDGFLSKTPVIANGKIS